MPISAKKLRAHIAAMKPLMNSWSIKTVRRWQNKLGGLMYATVKERVMTKEHTFEKFKASWIIPKDERRQGVILYLHGGGYTCGDLEYATGFGAVLSADCGVRVLCPAYRLAPEDPYPAALEDALEAYRYLLLKGYPGPRICVCGESAGGGLCYSLCLKLKEMNLPMPGCIIAMSPWTDLTASGASYEKNREVDPSMSEETLNNFAKSYSDDRENPLVSPLFGELTGMPPSLIFVGGDEILLSDSEDMHKKLLEAGCQSQLIVAPERWHVYLLYHLSEDRKDYDQIDSFLNRHMAGQRKLRWMRLDNAAKIYPAARDDDWSNVFRLSATLREDVDVPVLQTALDITIRRFPSIAVRLRRGVFWYYLEELSHVPDVQEEKSFPLTQMSREEVRTCAFRVIVYKRRIAVELFHSLTDGNGALVFLKSLVAEYLQQKYGVYIPAENGVLGRLEDPSEAEMEDSFPKYAGSVAASRKENNAWHLSGTLEAGGFKHLTCFTMPVKDVLAKAHEYDVSLTCFLSAVMLQALQNMQKEMVPNPRRRKPLRLIIPVNLRNIFPSQSLRNFAYYTTAEIIPRLGEYSFPEICQAVHHRMGLEINAKQMSMKIATNVNSEKMLIVRIMPLFIKNMVMKAVFRSVGEKKSCLGLSNLGAVKLPDAMMPYVERMDFILGVQATAPHNCGVLSFKDTLYINFIRDTKESDLEYHFFRVLRDMGLQVQVESNAGER